MVRFVHGDINAQTLLETPLSDNELDWFLPQVQAMVGKDSSLKDMFIPLLENDHVLAKVRSEYPDLFRNLTAGLTAGREPAIMGGLRQTPIPEPSLATSNHHVPRKPVAQPQPDVQREPAEIDGTGGQGVSTGPKPKDPDIWKVRSISPDFYLNLKYKNKNDEIISFNVVDRLSTKWKDLARLAGFSTRRTTALELDYPKDSDKTEVLLKQWIDNGSSTQLGRARWDHVINVLSNQLDMGEFVTTELVPALEYMEQHNRLSGNKLPALRGSSLPATPKKSDASGDYRHQWGEKKFKYNQLGFMKYTNADGKDVVVRINNELASDWEKLAHAIGVEPPRIASIKIHRKQCLNCLNAVIQAWVENGSQMRVGKITWSKFIEVLCDELEMEDYVNQTIIPALNAMEEKGLLDS